MRRARLVAREYKVLEKRDDIFSPATTPALTRLIPCVAMMRRWCVYAADIKDAFLQVPQKRKVLCTMDEKTREKRMRSSCASWRLLYVLPGQRDAAQLWSDFLAEMLEKYGMTRCISSPTLFRKMIDAMVVMVLVVHVDDLQIAGEQEESNKLISDLSKETKLQKEGPFLTREERERGYSSRSMRFLKRKFVYKDEKLFVYPDKKYFSKLCEIVKVQNRKSKNTPAPTEVQHEDRSEELDAKEQSLYRSAVGLLLYVAHDRPDIQFAVRSLASFLQVATRKNWKHLEHLTLYLLGTQDYCFAYQGNTPGTSTLHDYPENQEATEFMDKKIHLLEVFSDSDWAGDRTTRKSCSGSVFFLNGEYIFSYSRTQRSVTLSSAEAEYYALTGATSEALGLQEATRFLTGDLVELKAFTDSSSARAIAARQGVGKIKHLATRMLWLQQAQKEGRLSVHSVPTSRNPADIATKPLASKRILLLMYYLRFFNNGKRIGEEQHQEAKSKELVRRVSKSITKSNNMMQMFHVILASALQYQSEAAAVFHDRAEVPQGISNQMDSTLLPQEAMDWRWNFQMVCGFALGVFTTMAIVYYRKMKKEKRSEDEALDEVQESLDNYLIGALRVQQHQRGVLIRSKVGELLKENSFLRARRQQGEEDLDRVHNQVEELQLENENLKKEIKELKNLILEDEAMDEDLAAEEEEKEEDPEVQSEEKQRPEESTTDDDMPALIPAEGDAPVVNEEAMERRKRELAIMREKAKKEEKERKKVQSMCGEKFFIHLQSLQVQAINIPQKFNNNKEKKEERKESQQERVKAKEKEKRMLHTKAFISFKPRTTMKTKSCSLILVSSGSSSNLPLPTKPSRKTRKVVCTTQMHLSKEKVNGWIRPTGIGTKEDGLRMTETEKDKRKERLEKDQVKKSSSRRHSSSKEIQEVTKEVIKSRKDRKVTLEKEKVARIITTARITRKAKEKGSPGGQPTM